MLAHINLFGIIKSGSNLLVFHSGTGWEYFFQGLCPGSNCLFHGYTFVSVSKLSFFRNRTNHFVIQSKCSYFFYICSIHFKKKITVSRFKVCGNGFFLFKCNTQFITKCHLRGRLCNSFAFQSIGRFYETATHLCRYCLVHVEYIIVIRKIIRIFADWQTYKYISCFFQFRCDNIGNRSHIHSK